MYSLISKTNSKLTDKLQLSKVVQRQIQQYNNKCVTAWYSQCSESQSLENYSEWEAGQVNQPEGRVDCDCENMFNE